MSNIEERKRKLKELLAYSQKTSWRRKTLEKRIGEIVSYLTQTVDNFNVYYAVRPKAIYITADATNISKGWDLEINWFATSNAINKSIVIFLEQLLEEFDYYGQQE